MRIYDNISQTVGNTPLVRINRLAGAATTVVAKLESFNPANSVKGPDRGRDHRCRRSVR